MGIGNKFLLFSCAQILRPKNVLAVWNGPILCSGYGSTFTLVCTPKKHLSSSDVSIWKPIVSHGGFWFFRDSEIPCYCLIRGVDQLLQFIFNRWWLCLVLISYPSVCYLNAGRRTSKSTRASFSYLPPFFSIFQFKILVVCFAEKREYLIHNSLNICLCCIFRIYFPSLLYICYNMMTFKFLS